MNEENMDALCDSIKDVIEVQSELKESVVSSFVEQSNISGMLQSLSKSMMEAYKTNLLLSTYDFSALKQAAESVMLSNISFQIGPSIPNALQIISDVALRNMAQSMKGLLESYSSIVQALDTPTINWLRCFDYSSFFEALKPLAEYSELYQRRKELNEVFLQAMYESKWFPYAGWMAKNQRLYNVLEIIRTSRGASERREKRIDKAIMSFYTAAEIRHLKKEWWASDLDYCIRKTMCQSIDAYLRCEYALVIAALSTMWEGLIYIKANHVAAGERKRQRMEITKQELKELVKQNNYEEIFSNYFDDFIVSNCNEVNDVVEGVPNRHSVSHSWYKKYPNKKAALNAILLTDFIINLNPIEISEDANAGQS